MGILQARILEWVAMPLPGDLPDTGNESASFLSPTLVNGYHWRHLGSPIIYSHRVYLIYISKFCVLHRSPLSYFSSSSSLTWYFTVTLQSVPLFTFKYNFKSTLLFTYNSIVSTSLPSVPFGYSLSSGLIYLFRIPWMLCALWQIVPVMQCSHCLAYFTFTICWQDF